MSEYSKNERAELLMGRRLTPEQEEIGIIALDYPCELGFWCPTCRVHGDANLNWSEYNGFLWCGTCDFDWPSALCVDLDAERDPSRDWRNGGREDAVRIFLDIVRDAQNRAVERLGTKS